jgi:streptogramin lyase
MSLQAVSQLDDRRASRSVRAALVAAVAFAALVLAVGAAGTAPATRSLVLVDAAKNRVVASLPLHAEPMRVSYGDGAFWVVAPHSRTVIRVDPRRRSVQRRTLGEEPYDAATGAGRLWVPDHDGTDVLGVTWRTGTITRSPKLGPPQLAVAFAFGSVWVVGADGAMRRFDPQTLKVTGIVEGVSQSSEGFEPKIAVARDALWVSDAVRHVVVRVDPVKLKVTSVRGHGGYGVAVAAGTVWSTDGSFYAWRVDGGASRKLKTGNGAVDVAGGGGSIWVANRFAGTLVRVDPRRARITRTIRIPGRSAAVAYGGGFIAVALL